MPQILRNIADEYRFALETAKAVRAGNWDAVDREALLNELECSIAGSMRVELGWHFTNAIRAKLLLQHRKGNRKANRQLLLSAFEGILTSFEACPSLRHVVTDQLIGESYEDVTKILTAYRLRLPDSCPYSRKQLMKAVEELNLDW